MLKYVPGFAKFVLNFDKIIFKFLNLHGSTHLSRTPMNFIKFPELVYSFMGTKWSLMKAFVLFLFHESPSYNHETMPVISSITISFTVDTPMTIRINTWKFSNYLNCIYLRSAAASSLIGLDDYNICCKCCLHDKVKYVMLRIYTHILFSRISRARSKWKKQSSKWIFNSLSFISLFVVRNSLI